MDLQLAGYTQLDTLYCSSRTVVYRAGRLSDEQTVIVKVLRNPHPNVYDLVQFHNQYVITRELSHPGIPTPIALERYGNGYALILPDDGFISLRDGWRRSPLDWDIFFQITQQLADILHYLHRQQIVHKDIKPANILIHPTTHQLKLIDFSIASLLPKEQQQFVNPQGIQGTLGYISPEQTGRMNRGVDYRTDFYSLGVTFYELLTGQLPFDHEDPLAIIHAHIAQVPPSLATQRDEQGQPYPEAIAPKQVVAARNSYGGTGFDQ